MRSQKVRPSAGFRDLDAARKPKQLPTPALECLHIPLCSHRVSDLGS